MRFIIVCTLSFFVFLLLFSDLVAQKCPNTIEIAPVRLKLKSIFYSTPIKSFDNHVVVASHNRIFHVFDSKGTEINQFTTKGWIHATPTQLSDSTIGIGCYDGSFYFFDKEGNYIKKFKSKGFIFTEPVEIGKEIAFGVNCHRVAFYDRKSEELSYLKVKGIVHGSPLFTTDSMLVIGSNSKHLYFIDSEKNLRHSFKTNGWIMHSKPCETIDNHIIVGSYDRHLYAINKSGELVWKFETDGRIHGSPIQMPDSTIVFGSFDGYIYLISFDGKLISKIKTDGKVISSPAQLTNSIMVIGSYDKHLYFFDTKGKVLGKYHAGGKIFSSPIVLSCGTVFCCTTNGNLSFLSREYIDLMIENQKEINNIPISQLTD